MSSSSHQQNPVKFTITLFGTNLDSMKEIGSAILKNKNFVEMENDLVIGENELFRIIIIPDFFKDDCPYPDQLIIDLMAHSDSGIHLFIVATENHDKITQLITRLTHFSIKPVKQQLLTIIKNNESSSVIHCFENGESPLEMAQLADCCYSMCKSHEPFQSQDTDYSKKVVDRRKPELKRKSDYNKCVKNKRPPLYNHENKFQSASDGSEDIFNIILLGSTGTGKSASANTIVNAGKHNSYAKQYFTSQPSPVPVTTECEEKIVEMFGRRFRVVDTPDFFYDEEDVNQAQVEKCKRYCQPPHCVVLLVIQLGRFTDGERGILPKLEKNLGWMIRDKTIILFTHGEDLQGSVDTFIRAWSHLKCIIDDCSKRYHVFKNTSSSSKQVTELIKNFPGMFPISTEEEELSGQRCCLC